MTKDIKGSVLIRTDDVELKNLTVDGDLIIGCGAADGKITLDNVTVQGRLLVWGGGTKAVYCNNGTNMSAVVVARVDDAVKVIYDRDSTSRSLTRSKPVSPSAQSRTKKLKLSFTMSAALEKHRSSSTPSLRTIKLLLLLLLIYMLWSENPA